MNEQTEINVCPKFSELIEPVYQVLVSADRPLSLQDMRDSVAEAMNLSDIARNEPYNKRMSKLEYRLEWARSYLKAYGAIQNISRGIWTVTPEFRNVPKIDGKAVVHAYQVHYRECQAEKKNKSADDSMQTPIQNVQDESAVSGETFECEPWKSELMQVLLNMNPFGFERLVQKLLTESGFTGTEVTKKTGDGGLDGYGEFCINGLLTFTIAFQCKRYAGQVHAGEIRDFRGSLAADIEKGLFITTGTFTQNAVKEASAAGKQKISLIDGEAFMNMLLEHNLGVHQKTVYEVDKQYFDNI